MMDRRYVIGVFIGILLTLGVLWINTLMEDFQKQEQAKIETKTLMTMYTQLNDEVRILKSESYATRGMMREISDSLPKIRSDVVFLRDEMNVRFDDVKHRLGLEY